MSPPTPPQALAGFVRRFLDLTGGYWSGDLRWTARLLTLALVALTILQVTVPILINLWSEELFDALEQRSMDRFVLMIGAVGFIILFHIATMVLHLRVRRRLQLSWRQWLTNSLLCDWLTRGRHHQIAYLAGDHHDNPDGRIAEDIRITTEYAIDLGHSLSYCLLLLISFTNILWMLSGALELTIAGTLIVIPGYLLYIALIYAAAGTTIALVVGQPLVRAVNRRQGYEADFRFGLAHVRENAQAIALLHGESDERRRLTELFGGVTTGWHRQTLALYNMMVFGATYTVLSAAFPILVAAPSYITGVITLGVLMQTAQAFQQMVAALSWPIDNLARAAEWKASVERVLSLHAALRRLDRVISGEEGERIEIVRTDAQQSLFFNNVTIAESDGRVVIEPFSIEIARGDRVLIVGDPGAAIRLFRAVARVWPWGRGEIRLPAHTRIFVMPERPYLPRGCLRAILSYPACPDTVSDHLATQALERVGLAHLLPRLDMNEPWSHTLVAGEQQRLGFARLLVRRPDWIFVDHATASLDPEGEEEMLRLVDSEFPHATLLTIGSHIGLEAHHRRKLTLERSNGSVRLTEQRREPPPGPPDGGA